MPYRATSPKIASQLPRPQVWQTDNVHLLSHNELKRKFTKSTNAKEAGAKNWFQFKRSFLVYGIFIVCFGGMWVLSQLISNNHELVDFSLRGRSLMKSMIVKSKITQPEPIPIYFINLDKSTDRRDNTFDHLKSMSLEGRRVRALNGDDVEGRIQNTMISLQTMMKPVSNELACIASHLIAIYRAIHEKDFHSSSPYALIIEDDVHFEFDVDYSRLIESAPKDFAVLQLMTSNAEKTKVMYKAYTEETKEHARLLAAEKAKADSLAAASTVWTRFQNGFDMFRSADEGVGSGPHGNLRGLSAPALEGVPPPSLWKPHAEGEDLWSTQAYIVHKEAVRAFVDRAVELDSQGVPHVKLLPPKSIVTFSCSGGYGCYMPYRVVADIYLYMALGKTYTSRIPLLNGGHSVGYRSTIQADGLNIDNANAASFVNIHKVIQEVRENAETALPSFIKVKESDKPPAEVSLTEEKLDKIPDDKHVYSIHSRIMQLVVGLFENVRIMTV